MAGCSAGPIVAPATNEAFADRNVIVVDEGQGLMLAIPRKGQVGFAGLPGDSVDIECWLDNQWHKASPGDGWRKCDATNYVFLRTADRTSPFWSNAAICTDCFDPSDRSGYRRLVLEAKPRDDADAGGNRADGAADSHIPRCSEDASCGHPDPPTARCSEDASCGQPADIVDHGFVLGARAEGQLAARSGVRSGERGSLTAEDSVALQFDLGYQFTDAFYFGLYVGFGLFPSGDSNRITRGGAAIEWTLPFRLGTTVAWLPYLRASFGGCVSPASGPNLPGGGVSPPYAAPNGATWVGPEIRAELGSPFAFGHSMSFGPYVGFSNMWIESTLYGNQSFGLRPSWDDTLENFVFGVRVIHVFPFHGDWEDR
jgi:hypothetical protein